MTGGNDKEDEGDNEVREDNIFGSWRLILEIKSVWYLIRQIYPIKATEEQKREKSHKLNIYQPINSGFV